MTLPQSTNVFFVKNSHFHQLCLWSVRETCTATRRRASRHALLSKKPKQNVQNFKQSSCKAQRPHEQEKNERAWREGASRSTRDGGLLRFGVARRSEDDREAREGGHAGEKRPRRRRALG